MRFAYLLLFVSAFVLNGTTPALAFTRDDVEAIRAQIHSVDADIERLKADQASSEAALRDARAAAKDGQLSGEKKASNDALIKDLVNNLADMSAQLRELGNQKKDLKKDYYDAIKSCPQCSDLQTKTQSAIPADNTADHVNSNSSVAH